MQEDQDMVSGESLLPIEDRMTAFFSSWGTTDHKPSRVIALYVKDSASYSRCQDWVRNLNYWMLEKESCDWMGHWKQFKKKNYLQLQSELIEEFYDLGFDVWLQETICVNQLCVFTEHLKGWLWKRLVKYSMRG